MFKNLRNRLLIINLLVTTIVLVVAFVAIYVSTYSSITNDIKHQLDKTSHQRVPDIYEDYIKPVPVEDFNSPSTTFWMTINTSSRIQIIQVFNANYPNLTEDIAITLAEKSLQQQKTFGTIKLDGTYWSYDISYSLSGYKLTFLDATNYFTVLNNLIISFIFVALGTFLIIFLFSKYLADKAILPVQTAFNKQKQFIANASHELKTPITVINTTVDLIMANDKKTVNSQKKWLGYIQEESLRMTRLTNNLLYLTRLDDFDYKNIHTPVNFSSIVSKDILGMEALAFERTLTIDSQITDNLMIVGYSDQLHQLVLILLDNAVKYADDNTTISVSLQKENNSIIYNVINKGPVIAKEDLAQLLDRFYRPDSSRNRQSGGYGLGLSIASSIVKNHKGTIGITNSEEGVTTVKVVFNS